MILSEIGTQPKLKEHLTWIELDAVALEHNLERIKMLTMPSAEILAVIKANAYGHGLLEIAKILEKKVTYFGVASIEEALKLRQYEIETPILLFGIHFKEQIERAIQARIVLSISSLEQAEMIQEVAVKLEQPAAVHLKIDTGMGRLGIPLRSAKKTIQKICTFSSLKLEGIYTHLPIAEETALAYTEDQIRDFQNLIAILGERGISFPYRHAANSAGIFNYKSAHLNLVRPGLALYGIYPNPALIGKVQLKPVLHWRARVVLIKTIHAGESVGYGRTFIAEEKTTVAVLPVGYSHGYPVALSNQARVLLNGKSYRVTGRVSMDYLVIDLGEDSAHPGDIATLLGSDHDESVSAEQLAVLVGSIPYEIVTRINPQIPRVLQR